MQISARNQLRGTIREVRLGNVMAEVVLELAGGQHLVSAITRGSAESLSLQVGDEVIALVKATEVMLGRE